MSDINVAVDAVVFGYDSAEGLAILLIKRKIAPFKGKWALPGGFVKKNESLDAAVERELSEETGIHVNYLEQLFTFGEPKRDPRQRVISIAYYGLVKKSSFHLHAATDAEDAQWFLLPHLPDTAFDHANIIDMAIQRLRGKLSYEPIGFELLDDKFPFSDLQKLYETIKGEELDRRNFKKKFLSLGMLDELTEKSTGKGRPGSLFRFDKKKYYNLKKKGILFEI